MGKVSLCEMILNTLYGCHIKIFQFLALAAILFRGAEPILVEGCEIFLGSGQWSRGYLFM